MSSPTTSVLYRYPIAPSLGDFRCSCDLEGKVLFIFLPCILPSFLVVDLVASPEGYVAMTLMSSAADKAEDHLDTATAVMSEEGCGRKEFTNNLSLHTIGVWFSPYEFCVMIVVLQYLLFERCHAQTSL